MKSHPPVFWRLKWLLILLVLFAIDFGPIPLSAGILLYVFLFRPRWFKDLIDQLYPPA